MIDKFIKYWTASLGRSCLIQIAAAAVVVPLACILIIGPLYILENTDLNQTESTLLLAGGGALFLLLTLGGSLAVGLWIVRRRASQLDAAFTPLGLAGGMYLLNGRQYHGVFAGRAVDVYFYRGPTLEIYVAAPLQTRLGIARKDRLGAAVAGFLNRQPIPVSEENLQPFNVYADDPGWATNLLATLEARTAIVQLLEEGGGYEIRQVMALPDAWLLRLYHTYTNRISAENARRWMDHLAALARVAESLPAPAQPVEPSALEKRLRTNRGFLSSRVLLVTCGVFAALALCMLLALVPVFITLFNESAR